MSGKSVLDDELIANFDDRAMKMQDEDYKKLEVTPCDVKSIQNTPKGISDFWMKAMINHNCGAMITEKDRPILGYLSNIELNLHKEGHGYDLIFTFLENSYFKETSVTKSIFMKDAGICDKTTCTPIEWKDACNPCIKKQKKKKGGKKVNVETKVASFFNFFESVDPEDDKWRNKKPSENEEEEEDVDNRLQDELELSDIYKDDLVPLALEYYLGVIEKEEVGEDDDDSDSGSDHGKNDDEDKKKKKAKKGVQVIAGGDK